mmetsp:Transcript_113177/g.316246  ORF Transcript_113177/g.316246 Transcript_113177/m.316246 type:complete len:311 (-) Transcript_113177:277-1209(-)
MAAVLRARSGLPLRPPRPIAATSPLPASVSGTSRSPAVFETTKPSTVPEVRATSTSSRRRRRPSSPRTGGESFRSTGAVWSAQALRAARMRASKAVKVSRSSKVFPSAVFGQETLSTRKSEWGYKRPKLVTKSSSAASPRIVGLCVFVMFTPRGARGGPPGTSFREEKLWSLSAITSEPSLFSPILLMTASSLGTRKHRGFGLPSEGRAEMEPTSAKPKPLMAPTLSSGTSSAFLSKPAATPNGVSNRSRPPNISCLIDGPEDTAADAGGRKSQSNGNGPVQEGSANIRTDCSNLTACTVARCANSGSVR